MNTKWYNWVGDPLWDEYCKFAWIFIFIPIGVPFFVLVAIGLFNAITGSTVGI